jgi:hypothetical protein
MHIRPTKTLSEEDQWKKTFSDPDSTTRRRSAALTHIHDKPYLARMLLSERDNNMASATARRIAHLNQMEAQERRTNENTTSLKRLLRTVETLTERFFDVIDDVTIPKGPNANL